MKSYSLKLKALVFATGLLFTPGEGIAQTVVTSTANGGTGTLRNAVINSSAGDTITFSPSLLANGSDTITLMSDIILYHGLVFQGINTATDTLYIDGAKQSRLFYLNMGNTTNKNVVFENMAFINGKPMVANPSGPEHGGAILANGVDTLRIVNCVLRGNETFNSGNGGAIHVDGAIIHLALTKLLNNSAISGSGSKGGAIRVLNGEMIIDECTFSYNNSNSSGGAIASYLTDVRAEASVFKSNRSINSYAGAAQFAHGHIGVYNSKFIGNISSNDGSAIDMWGLLNDPNDMDTIKDCLIDSNAISNTQGWGRGTVYADNTIIHNTTVSNNTSDGNTAGVHCTDCVLRNVSILNNTCVKTGGGLLIRNKVQLSNSTITGNTGDDGAVVGVSSNLDTVVVTNTIIAGNGSNDGFYTVTPISNGYNILADSPSGAHSTDQTNFTSALNLEPLGMYGGTTPTMPPMTTSVAYNAGDPTKFQRAQNGPIYGRRDIGAAERRLISTDTALGCGTVTFWGTTYNAPGTYYDTIYNTNSIDSVGILVLTGLDTSVVNNNGVLIAQDSNTATTYQWVDCNNGYAPVAGATSSTFVPTVNGTYALILTNGTCSDTSSCQVYNEVSIEEQTKQSLHFYPNPASNQLTIVTHGPLPNRLQIVDFTGRPVRSIQVENATVNLPAITGGVYLLQWVFEDGTIQVDRVIIH